VKAVTPAVTPKSAKSAKSAKYVRSSKSVKLPDDDGSAAAAAADSAAAAADSAAAAADSAASLSGPKLSPQEHVEEFEALRHHTLCPCLLIMLNYVQVLIETGATGKLKQNFDLLRRIHELFSLLGDKEKDKLRTGVVALVKEMPVFPYRVEKAIAYAFHEVERLEHAAVRRVEAEAEALRLEEESLAGSMSTTSLQVRKDQRARTLEQRRADAMKRAEATRQRKELYGLIQSDKITQIFNARANGGHGEVGWGKDNEEEMQALHESMDQLTKGINSNAISKLSTKEPTLSSGTFTSMKNGVEEDEESL